MNKPYTDREKYLVKVLHQIVTAADKVNFDPSSPLSVRPAAIIGQIQGLALFALEVQRQDDVVRLLVKKDDENVTK